MPKTCFKCNIKKPLGAFYKHPEMADGRLNKCKECAKKDVTSNRLENLLYYRTYDTERKSTPEAIAATTKNCRRWRKRNPRKYAAYVLLGNAVRNGRINRQPCIKCGEKAHAHHENYDKPLEVTWLCAVHHSERHKQMKMEGIIP